MSLDTYSALKASVADWLHRSDLATVSVDFVALAEAWFNRNLRVRQMETKTTSLVVTAEEITHPTDWVAWKDLKITTFPYQNIRFSSEENADHYATPGRPQRAVVRNTKTILVPVPNATFTYQGIYYAAIPPLSDLAPSNWLLAAYPDAYLYGSLLQATGYIKDTSFIPLWTSAFGQVVKEIENKKDSYAGKLVPRIPGAV